MAEGFIVIRRGWRENPIFKGEFSRGEAWLWLIENACWKPSRTRVKGETITLERGELSFSVRFLADAWGWSKSRVDRFLADLRAENMIETRSKIGTHGEQKSGHAAGQGQSIICICNYRKYQDLGDVDRDNLWDNSRTKNGTTAGQQRDKEEPRNQGTKEEVQRPRRSQAYVGSDPAEPADPLKTLWDSAKAYLGTKASGQIGRWIKDHGAPAVQAALDCAKEQNGGAGAENPLAFMAVKLRNGAEREAQRKRIEDEDRARFDRRFPERVLSEDEARALMDPSEFERWKRKNSERGAWAA